MRINRSQNLRIDQLNCLEYIGLGRDDVESGLAHFASDNVLGIRDLLTFHVIVKMANINEMKTSRGLHYIANVTGVTSEKLWIVGFFPREGSVERFRLSEYGGKYTFV